MASSHRAASLSHDALKYALHERVCGMASDRVTAALPTPEPGPYSVEQELGCRALYCVLSVTDVSQPWAPK